MYTIDELRAIIKEELDKKEYIQKPYSLFEPILYILEDGGKRLRPLLTLMAYNLYREDIDRVLKSAIGIEIFHNYTLLHDDVMDDAELRRGRLTVHKKWNSNVAILSGDAAAITAYQCIEHCEDKYLRRAIDFFNQVAMDVCRGQQYDMLFETRNDVSEKEYIEMIYLKTSVLLAGSLRHGALLADAPEHEYNALYEFGGYLGLAFQLQDDLLDVYGDPEVFGKKIGGDILCNKKTYMLIKALNRADEKQREELDRWLNADDCQPAEKIEAVTGLYNQLNIRNVCENKMREYYTSAMESLAAVAVAEERKKELKNLVKLLMYREM